MIAVLRYMMGAGCGRFIMERDSRDGGDFAQSAQQLMPDCFSLISGGMSSCYFVCGAFISRGPVENRIKKETAVQSSVFWQRKRRLNWHTKWNTRVKMSMSAFGMLADISKKKEKTREK